MKSFEVTNNSSFNLQIFAKKLNDPNGVIYKLKPDEKVVLYESQLSGDITLKVKKRLLSIVEIERDLVSSSFIIDDVESESEQNNPLSTRGRKKKQL